MKYTYAYTPLMLGERLIPGDQWLDINTPKPRWKLVDNTGNRLVGCYVTVSISLTKNIRFRRPIPYDYQI